MAEDRNSPVEGEVVPIYRYYTVVLWEKIKKNLLMYQDPLNAHKLLVEHGRWKMLGRNISFQQNWYWQYFVWRWYRKLWYSLEQGCLQSRKKLGWPESGAKAYCLLLENLQEFLWCGPSRPACGVASVRDCVVSLIREKWHDADHSLKWIYRN